MRQKKEFSTARIARISVLSALSVIGASIPFPSPAGTIAFDSMPGFFAAFSFGPLEGGAVCMIGHIVTALVHGSPLGILHVPIALGMGIAGWMAGLVRRRFGLISGVAIAIIVNTLLFPLAMPVYGWGGALSLAPFLLAASVLNSIAAAICSKAADSALRLAQKTSAKPLSKTRKN